MDLSNITYREFTEILFHGWPDLRWTAHERENTNLTYDDLEIHDGVKPTREEIRARLVEARDRIATREAREAKENAFQSRYPLQDQIIALILNNAARIQAMRDYWKSL